MNNYGEYQQPSYTARTRTTDAPVAMDLGSVAPMELGFSQPPQPPKSVLPPELEALLAQLKAKLPPSVVGMSGYLVAGVFLGLVLIGALGLRRSTDPNASIPAASPNAIMDNVVHLHARDIGHTCWTGLESKSGPARLTVAVEVGVDGKIRYVAASGESPSMRECVETHVKSWEFLPQAQAQTMAFPFEVDRR